MSKTFKWDGSYIGYIPSDSLIQLHKSEFTYFKIVHNEETVYCIGRQISGSISANHQCIIDEAKALFGIPKIGTHSLRHAGKTYVILRAKMSSDTVIQEELSLKHYPDLIENSLFSSRMCYLLAFWDIMGVKPANEGCVIPRIIHNDGYYPIGCREIRIDPKEQSSIPDTLRLKWFKDTSISEVVSDLIKRCCVLLNITSDTYIPLIRSGLEDICERIDHKCVIFIASIIERIINRISIY